MSPEGAKHLSDLVDKSIYIEENEPLVRWLQDGNIYRARVESSVCFNIILSAEEWSEVIVVDIDEVEIIPPLEALGAQAE